MEFHVGRISLILIVRGKLIIFNINVGNYIQGTEQACMLYI